MYIEPEVDFHVLKDANIRHDRTPHTVCMWPRANYRGPVQPPPENTPRPRVVRTIDQWGNIHEEIRKPLDKVKGL